MIRPNERVLKAITSLEHEADFLEFIGWLQASRESARDDAENAVDPHLVAVHQGESRALTELLRHVRNARETLRKTG